MSVVVFLGIAALMVLAFFVLVSLLKYGLWDRHRRIDGPFPAIPAGLGAQAAHHCEGVIRKSLSAPSRSGRLLSEILLREDF
jgi:hypothetical protein